MKAIVSDEQMAEFVRQEASHEVFRGYLKEHQARGGSIGPRTEFAMNCRGWRRQAPLGGVWSDIFGGRR